MAQLLFAKNQINVKIVYYGPGLSGKATCLEVLETLSPGKTSGPDSLEFEGELAVRLTHFPEWIEPIRERTVCLQLFTVPGAVFWDTFPHRLVLEGADALVFVADSSPDAFESNLEVWEKLGAALEGSGQSLAELPVVFQWNKRDLPGAVPVERLQGALNERGAFACESVAVTGSGVLEALKQAAQLAVRGLQDLEA